MPRYSPLPIVSIDPRNETVLAQQAAQVVYEASNRTLNDFSAGNPLAALIEGQAFAQGEFLYWANQLPEKILIEWIGPFLGAMRRLGTPAVAQIIITINPQNTSILIPAGTSFTTNPQLTGGQSYEFVSYQDLTIPAGGTQGATSVYSSLIGSDFNVPANSITGSSGLGGTSISITNPKPAVGGSNVETYSQVRERFFTLIRRRNLVSETDWQDFFIDLYGEGTLTSVQPNRSSQYSYNYGTDYARANGQVSLFVLGPNGVELSKDQLKAAQNAINFLVPIENQAHVFPITLSQVQYNLTVEVNPNGVYGSNFRESSLSFRNLLFSALSPGNIFPATMNPTVSDVDSAFYSFFDTEYRFIDPHIKSSYAYNTPNGLDISTATYSKIFNFSPTDFLLSQGDLIRVDNPNPVFYPVLTGFTPYSTNKFDQTIYGNLRLTQIQNLSPGEYVIGDVVYYDGSADPGEQGLHVVLENITVTGAIDILSYFSSGKISPVKNYSPWTVGSTYQYSSGGTIDPDIVQYDYQSGEFIPATPSNVPLGSRPGSLIWQVSSDFTLGANTNDITGAQSSFKLGTPINPKALIPGSSYSAGEWVFTPQVGSGPNQEIDLNYYYVDTLKGVVEKYAFVISSFTYSPESTQTVSNYFDSLVDSDILKEIVMFDGNGGLPTYKYRSRFKAGQYLEYRELGTSNPSYYIAAQFFTPPSSDINTLVKNQLIIDLAPTLELKTQFLRELAGGFSGQIGSIYIAYAGEGYVDGSYTDVPLEGGEGTSGTANIIISNGSASFVSVEDRGQSYRIQDSLTIDNSYLGGSGGSLVLKVGSISPPEGDPLNTPVRMFSFFKGDTTFFRNGSEVRSYVATESVTPIFDFKVYHANGTFVETQQTDDYEIAYERSIPFNNPSYQNYAEDIISDLNGGIFYRVMKPFTPQPTVIGFNNLTQPNTTRFEEFSGNLLRVVSGYSCEEPILSQSWEETSSIKLGSCQITIVPKSAMAMLANNQELVYVWENTESISEPPLLSWYTGSSSTLNPPNYGTGTLAL